MMALWMLFRGSWPLQLIAAVGVVALGWTVWLRQHDAKIEARAVTTINKAGDTLSAKAKLARSRVPVDGARERLLQGSCRDC